MRQIALTQGLVTLVDNADYDWLNQWEWCADQNHHTFYAKRTICVSKNKCKTVRMHRIILGFQPGDKRECDHRDGNGLNNQRSNLRVCTSAQNNQSTRKQKVLTSKYKGVSWARRDRRWRSHITVNNKVISLGSFDSEIDAARAYDAAAPQHHGEFALTNKMLGLL